MGTTSSASARRRAPGSPGRSTSPRRARSTSSAEKRLELLDRRRLQRGSPRRYDARITRSSLGTLSPTMRDRDLFANFDRMRREMDELFGDVLQRGRLARRGAGFSPAVDVVYASDPPRAIVTAELAGVSLDQLDLEIRGRQLILSGTRGPAQIEGELYQQIEIERG